MTSEMTQRLLMWYHEHQRPLPWRQTTDPYAIWLSEVMLQQTQVVTVIPYYHKFLSKYPTVNHLANAQMDEVLKLWEGLGYYSRAKRLIACAQKVVETFGGQFPKSKAQMLTLPGIGSYTAGAVLGIAYNIKEPAVDGNVLRVLSRYLAWSLDIANPKNRQAFEDYLKDHLPDDMRGFNQAMMELGAMVCTPKQPGCQGCPVKDGCTAFQKGTVTDYPVKTKKKKSPIKQVAVAALYYQGKYLMHQKDQEGLLGGFWALPYGVGDTLEEAHRNLEDWLDTELKRTRAWGLVAEGDNLWTEPRLQDAALLGTVKHVFTHQTWLMHLYRMDMQTTFYQGTLTIDYPPIIWVGDPDQMARLAITTAMKKNIALLSTKQ